MWDSGVAFYLNPCAHLIIIFRILRTFYNLMSFSNCFLTGLLSQVLEAPREPRRPKTHWDHVLEEMVWLSKVTERIFTVHSHPPGSLSLFQ